MRLTIRARVVEEDFGSGAGLGGGGDKDGVLVAFAGAGAVEFAGGCHGLRVAQSSPVHSNVEG